MAPPDGSQDSTASFGRHSHPLYPKLSPKLSAAIEPDCRQQPEGAPQEDIYRMRRWMMLGAYLGRVCIRIRNHLRGFLWLSLFVAASMALFWERFAFYMMQPSHKIVGPCIAISKGCAQLTKFTMLLLLLPVSRFFLTLGRSKIKWFFPVDELITFHRILGLTFAVAGLLHGLLFMSCTWPREMHADPGEFHRVFGPDVSQKVYYREYFTWTAISGFMILGIIMIGYPLASSTLRKSMWQNSKLPKFLQHLVGFNAFFYTHLFLLTAFFLAIWHGTHDPRFGHWPTNDTWIWILPGFAFWLLDRCIRLYRTFKYQVKYDVRVLKAVPFFGDVIALKIKKPESFEYKSGQYVLLQCPDVANFEWHPFTLSSAPEDPFLSVHIKVNGDWTKAVYDTFKQRLEAAMMSASAPVDSDSVSIPVGPASPVHMTYSDLPPETKIPMIGDHLPGTASGQKVAGDMLATVRLRPLFPTLRLDGPFGSPAQDYLLFSVVVLIGTGIGLTPYASIVRGLLHHIRTRDEVALDKRRVPRLSLVHKVYLHWTTRDQRTFDWLTHHIADFDVQDESLDVHIHNTEKNQLGDIVPSAAAAGGRPTRGDLRTWFASRTLSLKTTRRLAFAQQLRSASLGKSTCARPDETQTPPETLEPFSADRGINWQMNGTTEEHQSKDDVVVDKSEVTMDKVPIDGPSKKRFGRSYSALRRAQNLGELPDDATASGARTLSLSSFSRLETAARLNVAQEATEVKIATHKGRPDFDYILAQTKAAHPNTKIGVFFCGSPSIGAILRELCIKHSVGGTSSFVFQEELF